MNTVKDRIKLEVKLIKKFEYVLRIESGYTKDISKQLIDIKKLNPIKKLVKHV